MLHCGSRSGDVRTVGEAGAGDVAGLTDEQGRHVAMLGRLGLSDAEGARLRDERRPIVGRGNQLRELELGAIPPTAQVIPLEPVLRDDAVRPSLTVEQVLANAPRSENGFIKVRAVLE